MSRSVNVAHIIGRLGGDPEMSFTPSGKEVTTLSIACGRQWKDASGEKKEQTEWINLEAWGSAAKIIKQYTNKGDLFYAEGRIQTDKYEDKDNPGKMKYFTKVVVQEFMLLGSRGGTNAPAGVVLEAEDAPAQDFPF